jgi:KDO2-lipid IV(A) lauroyltransferase
MPGKKNKYEPTFSRDMLHPRYWLTWAGLGVGWLVAQLPYSLQMRLGRLLGKVVQKSSKRRERIARINLELCFPEKSAAEISRIVDENFASVGMASIEIVMSWWSPHNKLEKLVHIEGLEHLEKALEQGKGAILLSAHLTSMEMGGRLLSMFHPFHPLYRKHKNPVFELVMHRSRSNHTDKAIERGDMRGMMRSLKQNVAIWYAPDQNYGSEQSIFVNFFGQPASTITATSRLAGIYGSPVVPFFQQRLPNNQGYKLTIYPALENFPTEDIAADTQRINNIIEAEIRKMPEQYLWSHRRFKTRPEGMESVY